MRNDGRRQYLVDGNFFSQMRLGVQQPVVMAFRRHMGHGPFQILVRNPVFGTIGAGNLGKRPGRRQVRPPLPGEAAMPGTRVGQSPVPGVLELFHPECQADIVCPGRHGITGAPESFRARGAVVFHPCHRNHGQAQGRGQGHTGLAHVDLLKTGPQPCRTDILFFDAGIFEAFHEGFDHQLFCPHIPTFTETGAPHSDNCNFVFYPRCHGILQYL